MALILMGTSAGVFLIPYTALFAAYSSEVVFPLAEGSATGYLFSAAATFGFVLGLGSIAVIDNTEGKLAIYIVMGLHCLLLCLSLLATYLTKETLNRSAF